ncbi:uncharacterized protein PRCAT00001809001 [Priceomyces carsonii]|uniref:uncharacterized protein n=1 Tax=Priceomyces carsonii TaxID=28549 RepID=UPI002EDB114F|nr:unnamed protein product [Priceomyces carsonii]
MTAKEIFFDIINYFHKDDNFNRITFGLSNTSSLFRLIRWRASDAILLLLLFILDFFVGNLSPFERQFYINDLTIAHPFAERERVNDIELFLYAVWFPLVVIFALSLIITKPRNKIYVTLVSLLGLGISVFSTSIFTNILKNFIGRHRPDFLARCVPKKDTPKDMLVFAKDVCTSKDLKILKDGFRTTPSGHSSMSFSGLFYLSMWLSGQLVVTNELTGSWRTTIAFIPTLGASLIAISRTEDYRHHFVDIIIGAIIGTAIASWSYFRLFPSLFHRRCYEPILIIKESGNEEESETNFSYNTLNNDVL